MAKRTGKVMIHVWPLAAALLIPLVGGSPAVGQPATKDDKPAPQDKPASPADEKPAPAKSERATVPGLQELLTQALRGNPDIRMAETKLREAEAELNRTRLQVTRKVVALHQAVKTQKELIESAEAAYQAAEATAKLRSQQHAVARTTQVEVEASKADLELAKTRLITAKAKLAEIEAELPYQLGKYPQVPAADPRAEQEWISYLQAYRQFSEALMNSPVRGNQAASPPLPTAMADKIRKALDEPVSCEFENASLTHVLAYFEGKNGIRFFNRYPNSDGQRINIRLKEVPLAAALQAVGDFVPGGRFVVRDYGILVTDEAHLPPGATLVENFWKAKQTAKPASDGGKKVLYKGLIQDVEAKTGLFSIPLGGDNGVHKGDTLEIYRLSPKPTFVGTARVVDVAPARAVARPVTPLKAGPIRTGDQFSIQIIRGH